MGTWNTVIAGIYKPTSNLNVGNVLLKFERTAKDGSKYEVKRRVTVMFAEPQIIAEGSWIILEGDLDAKHEVEWNKDSEQYGQPKYWEDRNGNKLASVAYILYGATIRDVREPKPAEPAPKLRDEDDERKYGGYAPF